MKTIGNSSIRRSVLWLMVVGLVLLLGALAINVAPARAAGTVTNCTTYDGGAGSLKQALSGGGTITFACSGTLVVPEITITANTPTVIDATGQTVTLSGNNANRVFNVSSGKSLTLRNITITGGNVTGIDSGGGILNAGNLTLDNSTVSGNATDAFGGGIAALSGSTLTLNNSTISGNSADQFGGGISLEIGTATIAGSNISGNSSGRYGGGVYSSGSFAIANTDLYNNQATEGGGGIYNDGNLTVTGTTFRENTASAGGAYQSNRPAATASFTNTTFSGNQALGTAAAGGGALLVNDATVTLTNVTVADNSSATNGGGISQAGGTVTMDNTIVGDNSAAGNGPDLSGTITSAGYNLVEDTSGATFTPGTGDITGQDPKLGPLANNGGPTQTHALLAGSPAFNAGMTDQTVDQRGQPRPALGTDDIGAYELQDCGDNWSVGTESELNAAIDCFNSKTVASSYTITVTQDISLTASIHSIDNPTSGASLVIVGGNHTVDGGDEPGNPGEKGFDIQSPTAVSMSDLTVTRCRTLLSGAAIHNYGRGELTLNNVTLTHNGAGFGGGALLSLGPVTITNSLISNNRNISTVGGGGILIRTPGSLTLTGSEVSDNTTVESGGGIYATDGTTVTIESSTITGNSGVDEGGAVYSAGALTITDSTISDNSAQGDGGGIANYHHLTVEDNSIVLYNNGDNGGGIYSAPATVLTITNSAIADNAAVVGGGLYLEPGVTATISGSDFDGNQTSNGDGGAILILENSTVAITGSTFTDNTAAGSNVVGGALQLDFLNQATGPTVSVADSTFSGNTAAFGAGAVNVDSGALTVSGVTFVNNRSGTAGGASGTGGALQSSASSTTTISNSTFSGNQALGNADDGGGAIMVYAGTVSLHNVTVASNSSAAKGGGISQSGGTITMDNTIVGDNTAATTGPDLAGTITSAGYNLVENTSGATFTPGTGDITGQDPKLGPLADNGGPTWTHALLEGSPAINAGMTDLTVDQRGVARPQGAADDIGAYEREPVATYTLAVTKDGTGSGTVTSTPAGIDCGTTCSASFNAGTVVTLTATADTGSTFAGWSGAGCSGTGTCLVTMDAAKSVTATFTKEVKYYIYLPIIARNLAP